MTILTSDQVIDAILAREGSSFTNDPTDRGGATKYGVTLTTLREWRHNDTLDATAVEALTESEARTIIRQKCLISPGLTNVRDDRARALVADMIWHHGLKGATLIIQRACKLVGDGILGAHTLEALNAPGAFERVLAERLRFMSRLVARDPTQVKFIVGWIDRCADFLAED